MSTPVFRTLTGEDFKKAIAGYRAMLLPDELSFNHIMRSTDLMHTPIMSRIDGKDWRPVLTCMIGVKVGARRVRRPV